MFWLTDQERKVLLLIAALILIGALLRFFHIQDVSRGRIYASPTINKIKIDVNQAGPVELQTSPGIGPVTAQRIIEHRSSYGSFADLEDLEKVKGIGPKKSQRMKEYIIFRE